MLPSAAMNIIVTGTSRGIGLEFCRLALASEARVLAVARKPDESPGLKDLQKKSAAALKIVQADVSRPEAVDGILEAARAWGPIDVLINNAGVYRKGETAADFAESFSVNAFAPFQLSKTLLPCLRQSLAPKLVQITSLMGSVADNGSGGSLDGGGDDTGSGGSGTDGSGSGGSGSGEDGHDGNGGDDSSPDDGGSDHGGDGN